VCGELSHKPTPLREAKRDANHKCDSYQKSLYADSLIATRHCLEFVSLLLSATAGAENQAPPLGLTKITPPAGASNATAAALDAQGNVFGQAQLSSGFNAIKWIDGTTPVVYPRLTADQNNTAIAYGFIAVNAAGAAVGAAGITHAPYPAAPSPGSEAKRCHRPRAA
jgi:hypothetical protein